MNQMEPKTQLSLYNILDELTTWENTLELATTPEQEQEIQSRIREYLTAGRDKVDRYCQMLAHLDGEIVNALAEFDRLNRYHKRVAAMQSRLLASAQWAMEANSITQLTGTVNGLKLRKNPPSVVVLDESLIPVEYWDQKPTPPPPAPTVSKVKIAQAIKIGKEVPGAVLRPSNRVERI